MCGLAQEEPAPKVKSPWKSRPWITVCCLPPVMLLVTSPGPAAVTSASARRRQISNAAAKPASCAARSLSSAASRPARSDPVWVQALNPRSDGGRVQNPAGSV